MRVENEEKKLRYVLLVYYSSMFYGFGVAASMPNSAPSSTAG